MATSEFSAAKTIVIVAVIIGCFAILWPNVFQPMMQTAYTITKPRTDAERMQTKNPPPVCCDIIYDYDINNQFFAQLCGLLVDTDLKKKKKSPLQEGKAPPGVSQLCRDKVLELCNIDIGPLLSKNPKDPKYKEALDDLHQQNITVCLRHHFEKHEKFLQLQLRRQRQDALRKQIRQERVPHMHPPMLHPAMREKGVPMATRMHEQMTQKLKPGPVMTPRPLPGGHGKILSPSPKTGGMGFIMPMYTVGIVIFFIYTVMKFWKKIRATVIMFKRSEDKSPQIKDFHMDPEYRKYALNEDYGVINSSTYSEYLTQKEREEKATLKKAIGDDERKLMFTAIEGIIAEMDQFREHLKGNQSEHEFAAQATENGVKEILDSKSTEQGDDVIDAEKIETQTVDSITSSRQSKPETSEESSTINGSLDESPVPPLEETRLSVVGMETQTMLDNAMDLLATAVDGLKTSAEAASQAIEKKERKSEERSHIAPNVPSIILETNLPADSHMLVAESQFKAELESATDDLEGDQPVIIAGKMTISLINSQTENRKGEETPTSNRSSEERTPTPLSMNASQSNLQEEMDASPVNLNASSSPEIQSLDGIVETKGDGRAVIPSDQSLETIVDGRECTCPAKDEISSKIDSALEFIEQFTRSDECSDSQAVLSPVRDADVTPVEGLGENDSSLARSESNEDAVIEPSSSKIHPESLVTRVSSDEIQVLDVVVKAPHSIDHVETDIKTVSSTDVSTQSIQTDVLGADHQEKISPLLPDDAAKVTPSDIQADVQQVEQQESTSPLQTDVRLLEQQDSTSPLQTDVEIKNDSGLTNDSTREFATQERQQDEAFETADQKVKEEALECFQQMVTIPKPILTSMETDVERDVQAVLPEQPTVTVQQDKPELVTTLQTETKTVTDSRQTGHPPDSVSQEDRPSAKPTEVDVQKPALESSKQSEPISESSKEKQSEIKDVQEEEEEDEETEEEDDEDEEEEDITPPVQVYGSRKPPPPPPPPLSRRDPTAHIQYNWL